VDAVHDTEEIVVKPLGKHFKGVPVFAGATIMGDGRIALILDILGVAKRARVIAEGGQRGRLEATPSVVSGGAELQTLLVFRGPDDSRMAIPLSRVARLEEFPRAMIERVGQELLAQYRGEIMPVLELGGLLLERRPVYRGTGPEWPEVVQVVVFADNGVHVGLIVEQILDIVEDSLENQRPPGRPGVLGSVVIASRVTELLDVEAVLRRAQPGAAWNEVADVVISAEEVAHGA
jgi:two-component system chemotaxis sensor kinase CheA